MTGTQIQRFFQWRSPITDGRWGFFFFFFFAVAAVEMSRRWCVELCPMCVTVVVFGLMGILQDESQTYETHSHSVFNCLFFLVKIMT